MSIPAIGASASVTNAQNSATTASTQRAADGDYKTPGPGRATVKEPDGDYKPLASAQSTSSSAVQAAISALKQGG